MRYYQYDKPVKIRYITKKWFKKLLRRLERNIMKNFEFEHNNKKYWYSRSVAVVGIIQAHDRHWEWHVLATKRGKGVPDFKGFWCLPCGYLDFNETTEQALHREVFEETGFNIKIDEIKLIGIDSIPEGRQNVTIRYNYIERKPIEMINLTNKNADIAEVDEVKFIKYNDISEFNWAFNHGNLLKKFLIL